MRSYNTGSIAARAASSAEVASPAARRSSASWLIATTGEFPSVTWSVRLMRRRLRTKSATSMRVHWTLCPIGSSDGPDRPLRSLRSARAARADRELRRGGALGEHDPRRGGALDLAADPHRQDQIARAGAGRAALSPH